MRGLPRQTLVFTVLVVLIAAVAVSIVLSTAHEPWTRHAISAALILFGTVLFAELFDVSFPQSVTTFHVSVSAAFGLGAALTVNPALGALAVMAAHLADGIYVRREPIKTVVNAAVHGLSTLASGLTFLALADSHESILGSYRNLGAVMVAAAVYTVVNSGLLAVIVAPIVGITPVEMWRANFDGLYVEMLTLVTLGSLVPVLMAESPLAVLLLVVPLFIGPNLAFRGFQRAQEETRIAMEGLADAIERRDPYTYHHSIRVTEYVRAILDEMPPLPRPMHGAVLGAARVHDLGKIGMRDVSLNKPGPLSASEQREMQRHATIGAEIVGRLGVYQLSLDFIRHHHERWDGTGYPDGLRGEVIPLGARVIAVADAFDAMTSTRVYRPALSPEVALARLRHDSGTQFDPQVIEAFIRATRPESLHQNRRLVTARAK